MLSIYQVESPFKAWHIDSCNAESEKKRQLYLFLASYMVNQHKTAQVILK